jgi:hypothetical protein
LLIIIQRNIVGCGNHKDTVLRNIPVTNRCTCKATNQNNVLQEYKPFSSGLSYSTKPSNPSRQ